MERDVKAEPFTVSLCLDRERAMGGIKSASKDREGLVPHLLDGFAPVPRNFGPDQLSMPAFRPKPRFFVPSHESRRIHEVGEEDRSKAALGGHGEILFQGPED